LNVARATRRDLGRNLKQTDDATNALGIVNQKDPTPGYIKGGITVDKKYVDRVLEEQIGAPENRVEARRGFVQDDWTIIILASDLA